MKKKLKKQKEVDKKVWRKNELEERKQKNPNGESLSTKVSEENKKGFWKRKKERIKNKRVKEKEEKG